MGSQEEHDYLVEELYDNLEDLDSLEYDFLFKEVEYGVGGVNPHGECDVLVVKNDLWLYLEVKSSESCFGKGKKQVSRFESYYGDVVKAEGRVVVEDDVFDDDLYEWVKEVVN